MGLPLSRALVAGVAVMAAVAAVGPASSDAARLAAPSTSTYVFTARLSPTGTASSATGTFSATLSSGVLRWRLTLPPGIPSTAVALEAGHNSLQLCGSCRAGRVTRPEAMLSALLHGDVRTAGTPALSGRLQQTLSYETASRTATLTLVGALGGDNSGLNFNGYSHGALKVAVPRGWRVTVECSNAAYTVRHSCALVQSTTWTAPAFPGASTRDAASGIAHGSRQSFAFVANRAGSYRIVSLVPGQAASGMWASLSVTGRALPSLVVSPGGSPGLDGIRVSGNKLLDNGGTVIRLHGVNYSGTEYACVQGWGIFDGPSDQTMVNGLRSWDVNIVRIPLNEDCWLDINGMNQTYAGASYQKAIVDFVDLLHRNGIYAELSLMWGAPGSYRATYQPGGPDEDHSPAMWSSMAATFKNDQNVILAPWGETITGWACFMQTGCSDQATYGPDNAGYQTAPMQQAVTLMRQAGYNGPIVIPCISYANQCANYNGSSWLATHPSDPDNQLVAEAHVYGKNTCDTTGCFDTNLAPLAQRYPLIFGETGETYDSSDCGSSYISTFLNWADAHGVGYEAWTWDAWGNCGALIADFNGTPANAYAQWVHDHYLAAEN